MENRQKPSFAASAGVFLGIVLILIVGIKVLKVDIHVLLIFGLILASGVAKIYGYTIDDLMDGMKHSISRAMVAMVIFILIGTIIGSWIHAGTVPALIYYGLKFLSPKFFLPLGLIICSITSLATGTSWGTTGTVGLALMGMGVGLGIPAPIVAGMIVSGAFFGDKMSPISDTTNLAAVSAGTDLYKHIGAMLYTTVPAYIISLILYTIVGFRYSSGANANTEQIIQIQNILAEKFNLNPIVLLPIIVLLVMSIMKIHSIPAMLTGTFLGTIIAIVFQGSSLSAALTAINYGFSDATGVEIVDNLLLRGGIQRMMWTFSLSFIALCLGGVLEKVGYLTVLIEKIVSKIKSAANMVTLVIFTTALSNAAMGEIYLSVILNGSLYREAFEEKGLQKRMLSRLLEEGGTMTGALIPWCTAGAFVAATLGVPTMSYVPYAFLNILNPLISIILAYFGIFILRENGGSKKEAA